MLETFITVGALSSSAAEVEVEFSLSPPPPELLKDVLALSMKRPVLSAAERLAATASRYVGRRLLLRTELMPHVRSRVLR